MAAPSSAVLVALFWSPAAACAVSAAASIERASCQAETVAALVLSDPMAALVLSVLMAALVLSVPMAALVLSVPMAALVLSDLLTDVSETPSFVLLVGLPAPCFAVAVVQWRWPGAVAGPTDSNADPLLLLPSPQQALRTVQL